jgi:hypothetical protein
VKLRIIYNFITYYKIKKIVIKSIRTKCEEKTIEGLFWNFTGADAKFKKNREEKEMIIDVKPTTIMIHMLHHHVEGFGFFQTPLLKELFGGQTTSHTSL